jgi:preprotein translocase subunit SecE
MSFIDNVKTFFSETISELKKVSWPSRKEVKDTTIVVIIAVIIFGLYLFLIDLALQAILQQIYNLFT